MGPERTVRPLRLPVALDKRALRRDFERAAASYDTAAVLQAEIGDRILDRLAMIRIEPRCVLDAGAGTGRLSRALARRYRRARILSLDLAPAMLVRARRRSGRFGRQRQVCGDAEDLPLASGSCDLVVSNLMLQWCNDQARALAEFRRVLRPGGLLLFTTFGPDTLAELREAWGEVDPRPRVGAFVDLHDLGDALLGLGFQDPVMDAERLTLTYADLHGLMRDLRDIGAQNAAAARPRGLTGPRTLARVAAAYERWRRSDGRLPATWEVIHGHAWRPPDPGPGSVPVHWPPP